MKWQKKFLKIALNIKTIFKNRFIKIREQMDNN